MRKEYLEAGKIRNVHGLRGEVKAENWLDNDGMFAAIPRFYLDEKGEKELTVRSRRRQGELFLLAFEGREDADSVTALKSRVLYARRGDVDPEGKRVFFADLVGLELIDAETGEAYGTIADAEDRGGGILYVIELPDGRREYFPSVKEWIEKFDPEKGVFARVPKGLFDK